MKVIFNVSLYFCICSLSKLLHLTENRIYWSLEHILKYMFLECQEIYIYYRNQQAIDKKDSGKNLKLKLDSLLTLRLLILVQPSSYEKINRFYFNKFLCIKYASTKNSSDGSMYLGDYHLKWIRCLMDIKMSFRSEQTHQEKAFFFHFWTM